MPLCKTEIHLFEQNPPNATFEFGVVFSEQVLGLLARDDPETHACITPHVLRNGDKHNVLIWRWKAAT